MITWNTYERKDNPIEGRHRWLTVGVLATEAIVVYKYRMGTGNIYYNPTPIYVWLPNAAVLGFVIFYWTYLRFKSNRTKKFKVRPDSGKNK